MGLPLNPLAIAGQVAAPVIGSVVSAIPGKMETMYRQDIKNDRARLSGGAGGLTPGQRDQLRAEGANQIQAQQAANTATLARGSSDGSGDSGQMGQNLLASQKQAENATLQNESNVRNDSLQLAEAQRQQLFARMAQARAWGQQRKQESLGYLQQAAGAAGAEAGTQGAADRTGATGTLTGGLR